MMDLNRRGFLELNAAALAAVTGGDLSQQLSTDIDFQNAAFLIGPEQRLPDPDTDFFANKNGYHYIYWALSGARYELKDGDTEWTQLPVTLPVYDDIREVDNPVPGMRVQLDGSVQEPAGEWWYHNGQWFSGDRHQFTISRESISANDTTVWDQLVMPADSEIDIWQAHLATDAGTEDLFFELYDATADQVLYDYSLAANGNVVTFGNPIDVVPAPQGNTIEFRTRNATSGGVSNFSG